MGNTVRKVIIMGAGGRDFPTSSTLSTATICSRAKMANWLPLVDALRTLLLVPSPEVRGILDDVWLAGTLRRQVATS
jgi:hypothetical protein